MNTQTLLVECQLTHQQVSLTQAIPIHSISPTILEYIKRTNETLPSEGYVSLQAVNLMRKKHLEEIITQEQGKLSKLKQELTQELNEKGLLSRNFYQDYKEKLSFGDRVADKVAVFGGSWGFIGIFLFFVLLWGVINTALFLHNPFDPYPYIFLNLLLAVVASLQAPVIMMSQNRQEIRDHYQSQNDYLVNLKSEIEIQNLHEKTDLLLAQQWQQYLEIQQNIDELEENILKKNESDANKPTSSRAE